MRIADDRVSNEILGAWIDDLDRRARYLGLTPEEQTELDNLVAESRWRRRFSIDVV